MRRANRIFWFDISALFVAHSDVNTLQTGSLARIVCTVLLSSKWPDLARGPLKKLFKGNTKLICQLCLQLPSSIGWSGKYLSIKFVLNKIECFFSSETNHLGELCCTVSYKVRSLIVALCFGVV